MRAKLLPILERIPHRQYCEPFGGGASILIAKQPKPVEVYNDIDEGLYDFFMTLADPRLFEQFWHRVSVLPYSRQLYNECLLTWKQQTDRSERVWRWYVVARMSFAGRFGRSWGFAVTASHCDMASTTSGWISILDMLPRIHARLQRVQIEHTTALRVLDTYDHPDTLFYLDPPYIPDTREGGLYTHEMSSDDHGRLVEKLLTVRGHMVLSAYEHPIYQPLLDAEWYIIRWPTFCHTPKKAHAEAGSQHQHTRVEAIYVSPGAWEGLHG